MPRVRNSLIKNVVVPITADQKKWIVTESRRKYQSQQAFAVEGVRIALLSGFRPKNLNRLKLGAEGVKSFHLELPTALYSAIEEIHGGKMRPVDVAAWVLHAVFVQPDLALGIRTS